MFLKTLQNSQENRFWDRFFLVSFEKFLTTPFLWNTSADCFCKEIYKQSCPSEAIDRSISSSTVNGILLLIDSTILADPIIFSVCLIFQKPNKSYFESVQFFSVGCIRQNPKAVVQRCSLKPVSAIFCQFFIFTK